MPEPIPQRASCGIEATVRHALRPWVHPDMFEAALAALMADLARDGSAAARMLAEFHEHPNVAGTATNDRALRYALHHEEHRELEAELEGAPGVVLPVHARVARELADVVYVAYGTAWAYSIDLDAALREVHRAAMHKVVANVKREDGKVIKPPGFRPPDMTEALS